MDGIVTQFMLNSCLTERRSNVRKLEAVNYCVQAAWPALSAVTGSIGELYIEPALTCIGDIDIMGYICREIAVSDRHHIPRHLPQGYNSEVVVCEVRDSVTRQQPQARNMPGYVYLLELCTIQRHADGLYRSGKWVAQGTIKWHGKFRYILPDGTDDLDIQLHGPACLDSPGYGDFYYFHSAKSTDIVVSMLCLEWPQQATDWPTRSRNNGWPDAPTIKRAVTTGCAVVPVTHRRCRQDEFMNNGQWRLSFSVAEVVLLNSWTPVQQIVYHMLRFLVKTERLSEQTDDNGEKLMSNYHIKTVVLWAAELKPQKWWNDNLKLVRICTQLLKTMAAWMEKADYKQYFIPPCNLIDWDGTSQQTQLLVSRLRLFTHDSFLSDWFLRNYILQFVNNKCPNDVHKMFSDISSIGKLRRAVTAAETYSKNILYFRQFKRVNDQFLFLSDTYGVHAFEDTSQLLILSDQLQACVPQLRFTCNAAWCLHTARRLHCKNFSKKVLDMATVVFGQTMLTGLKLDNSTALHVGLYLMQRADIDMSRSLQLLQTELSFAYLQVASSHEDHSNGYCVSNVYLAARYYLIGDYQTAVSHCRMLMCSEDQPQCDSFAVLCEGLPPVDCDIDNALGLVVLYHYIQTAAVHQQQRLQPATVFTAQLFACYIHIQCLLKLQSSEIELLETFQCYRELLTVNIEPFITDIILYQLLCLQLQHITPVPNICLCQHDNINTSTQRPVLHYDTTRLQQLLVQVAVDQLTMFGQLQKQEFSPYTFVYPNEFRAMLAYKNKQYVRCCYLYNADICYFSQPVMFNDISLSITPSLFPLLDDDLIALRGLLLLFVSDATLCTYVSSIAMRNYLKTKCWMKCPRIMHSVASRRVLNDLVNIDSTILNSSYVLNGLVLSFVYRQMALKLKQTS